MTLVMRRDRLLFHLNPQRLRNSASYISNLIATATPVGRPLQSEMYHCKNVCAPLEELHRRQQGIWFQPWSSPPFTRGM